MRSNTPLKGRTLKGRTLILAAPDGGLDPAVLPLKYAAAGPATITGTLASTDGADSAAFVGDIAHAGTLAATDGADVAALAGDVAHVGSLAVTDGTDTAALVGAICHSGTLAANDEPDGFAATGTVEAQNFAGGPIIYIEGGAARRIKRRKAHKPLWEDMAEVYDALMEIGNAPEVAEVVAEYVEPAQPAAAIHEAVAIIPPPQIDWQALARDMDTVYRLVALYEKAIADQLDEDEAEMLLAS